jgi:signal transduction histidine kinase
MNSSFLPNRNTHIELLLKLEWMLLAIAAILQILVASYSPNLGLTSFNLLGLLLFTIMRWYFPSSAPDQPTDRWPQKLLYTAVGFGLLLLMTFAGNFLSPTLLYIAFTIRNCVLFDGQSTRERQIRPLLTFLTFSICLLSQTYRLWFGRMLVNIPTAQVWVVGVGFAIVFALVFLFLHLLVDAILAQSRGQQQLAVANDKLRQYALRVEELATLQERNRIARDIHDSLGHSMTVFNIHIEAVLRLLDRDPAEAKALLLEVRDLGIQALQEVRQSVGMLRAEPLQGRTLEEAIDNLVLEFSKTTGIQPHFTYQITDPTSNEIKSTLYRLVQESLTNIVKHGNAQAATITLHQDNDNITLVITDNGRGFDLQSQPSGFGLLGMQERTIALGGNLQIETAPNCGCQIRVTIPHADQ